MSTSVTSTQTLQCPDCRKTFPAAPALHKLCEKCAELGKHAYQSDTWLEVKKWPQCVSCGQSWKNADLSTTGLCGGVTCQPAGALNRGVNAPAQNTDYQHPETISQRSTTLFDTIRRNSEFIGPVTSHTTASLLLHENSQRSITNAANGKSEAINIGIQYRMSGAPKKLADKYGSCALPFDGSKSLWDVQDYGLKQLNINWTKNGRPPLRVTDTVLRQENNISIEEGQMATTLQKWYNTVLSNRVEAKAPQWGTSKPGAPKRPATGPLKPTVNFELFVFEDVYESRIEQNNILLGAATSSFTQTKRSGNSKRDRAESLAASSMLPSAKMRRLQEEEFRSSFALTTQGSASKSAPVQAVRLEVAFKKVICSTVTLLGDPIFVEKGVIKGALANEPFAHGLMKSAFDLHILDEPKTRYVAKRFFRLEGDASTHDDGYPASQEQDTTQFTQAPFTAEEHNKFIKLECARGVLGGQILHEFYCMCNDKGVSVFRDLRFTEPMLLQERGKLSPASGLDETDDWGQESASEGLISTGVGDFGQQGIDQFVKQHTCRQVCQELGFPVLALAASDGGNNSDSSGDEDSDAAQGLGGDDIGLD
ncbi:hypothetical protein FA15DRAFT_661342 [Coprinopsis marcescibilis]|uniref:Alpha-type protein kinase domain-containing protein n=1 Tax=Coprinopsis marcescibilis TaxID=230819 RepID=A0A5C3KC51_COPMA|nr:hypothetical protein FA15DRAFT_661342 [Coprinopsis marcescibilis]